MLNNQNDKELKIVLEKTDENHATRHADTMQRLFEMGDALTVLGSNFKKLFLTKFDTVALQNYEVQFFSEGFLFNSLFISDVAGEDNPKLIVKHDGMQYTQNLTAGENIVNIPDGATIRFSTTSGTTYSASLKKFNSK